MKKQTNHKKSGFTLIELMIVVIIIAVISSIAIPAYRNVTAEAIQSAKITNARAIQDAIQMKMATEGLEDSAVVAGVADLNIVGAKVSADLDVKGAPFTGTWTPTFAVWLGATPAEVAAFMYDGGTLPAL